MGSVARILAEQLVIGVDTHLEVHVAVAVNGAGVKVADESFATTQAGINAVRRWAKDLGTVVAWGIEGTGSYGAGLARTLIEAGIHVVEVNRPDRSLRRIRGGKTDTIDAEAAARAVLSGLATVTPKAANGTVEALRVIRNARSSAVKSSTQALNQIHHTVLTAPPALRDDLAELTTAKLVQRCARLRPRAASADYFVKTALRSLARRVLALTAEIEEYTATLKTLVQETAPGLLAEHGVDPDCAAALLITVGDNADRIGSEAKFAALCGTAPVPANSGKTDRHRLNRGGNRQANAALHRIAVVRLKSHPETRRYMATHCSPNGANRKHVLRCIKRALARRLYRHLVNLDTNTQTPQKPLEVAA